MARFVLAFVFLVLNIPVLYADVQVYDSIATSGQPVMLKARTGGRFFPKGGELVDFSIDGKKIGRTLSGGDGVAYLEYKPTKSGLLEIKAASGGDESTGVLQVFGKKDKAIIVEVAGALATEDFVPAPRKGASEAIEKLAERYRVIYVSTGLMGMESNRQWLKSKEFPRHAVLEWKGTGTLKHILDMGVQVKAAVGGAEIIRAAERNEGTLSFTFDPEADGKRVRSWDEILKELLP